LLFEVSGDSLLKAAAEDHGCPSRSPQHKPSRVSDRDCADESEGTVDRAISVGRCLSRLSHDAYLNALRSREVFAEPKTIPALRHCRVHLVGVIMERSRRPAENRRFPHSLSSLQ
jgi:hypothetical protein